MQYAKKGYSKVTPVQGKSRFQKKRDKFPEGEYKKMTMKNIGPCRILKKFSANDYELDIPIGVGISPIFNVVDLYPYVTGDTRIFANGEYPTENLQWVRQMPVAQPL